MTYTVTYRGFKGGFSFARLLAKIAYGLAVARFSANVIDTAYVLPAIMGKADDVGKWVGTEGESSSIAGHLAEIRSLIERWQGMLRTPQVDEGYRGIYSPARSLEADSLFNSLREHLPVPILWRNYTIWKKSLDEYVNIWKMLIEEIKQSVRSWQNVRRIRDDFQQPVLKRLSYKALERKLEPFRFEKRESGDYEILLVDGVETLETSDALAYEQQYKRLCDQVLGSELATNLINRFRELRAQEPKIRESLQEILQRRDYIMYSCKLCPGQPKLQH